MFLGVVNGLHLEIHLQVRVTGWSSLADGFPATKIVDALKSTK
jgi:hypothetical protein